MLLSSALPWAVSCSTSFKALALLLLHTPLKWLILPESVHFFPYAGHCFWGWLDPEYLHVCLAGILCVQMIFLVCLCMSLSLFLICQISFVSVRLFIMADSDLWASSLLAQQTTFSLVTSVYSSLLVRSTFISANMSVSFRL